MQSDIEVDALVVGGGGAGLAAAAEAAAGGLTVLLAEKEEQLGGSTAWSVGSISATGTRQQRSAGIIDNPDDHYADLEVLAGRNANRDNRAFRRVLVDEAPALMTWLEDLGLTFVGPNPEPPHRRPRMHNVLPNSNAFPHHLGRHCRRLGVDIRLGHRARSLSFEGGRCTGARLGRSSGGDIVVRAKGGVILAGGDYSASPELRARLAGPAAERLEPVNPAATGDGLQLGLEAGGTVVNGDIIRGPILRFVPPAGQSLLRRLPPSRAVAGALRMAFDWAPKPILRPFAMAFLTTALGPSADLFRNGAILVDGHGRHVPGDVAELPKALAASADRRGYILLDGRLAEKFTAWPNYISTAPGVAYAYLDDYRRNRADIVREAPTVHQLARMLGVDEGNLAASVRDAGSLSEPPFVALGPVGAYVVFTDGGLAVDIQHRVLDVHGQAIAGLYAAGSNGQGGVLLEGHGHHLAWAFISGRRAGRNIAAEIAASRTTP